MFLVMYCLCLRTTDHELYTLILVPGFVNFTCVCAKFDCIIYILAHFCTLIVMTMAMVM